MGMNEGNQHVAPDAGGTDETERNQQYSSPISQPGAPTSLSIPDPVAHEPRAFKDEVRDMLSGSTPRPTPTDSTAKQAPEPPVESAPPPTKCSKCGFKLSSLDIKMGQCFKCGAAVGLDPGRDRPSRGSITVGI